MLFAVLPPHAVALLPGPSLLGPEPLLLVRQVLEVLDREAMDLPALASSIGPLTRALAGYEPAARQLLDGLGVSEESSRLATFATPEREGQQTLEHYVVYDAHFGLRRRLEMTWTELSAQLALTALRLLQDLPRTLLARRHWHSLLLALERMLAQVGGDQPGQPLDPAPLEGDVVDFRWRNGHHVFCLTSLFGRLALERALNDLEQAGPAVDQAADLVQATSAAMAYTTDFPSRTYLERVRPAMPPGFSGSQNSDYNHLKLAKGRLAAALSQTFAGEASWPPSLLNALRRFRVLDQLDLDEHILIAAQQIGLIASLKQIYSAEQGSAIEALRRTQSQRWLEFRLP